MKTDMSMLSVFLLLVLLSTKVKGIRLLEEVKIDAGLDNSVVHVTKVTTNEEGIIQGKNVNCGAAGQCNSGKGRKLITSAVTNLKNERSNKMSLDNATDNPSSPKGDVSRKPTGRHVAPHVSRPSKIYPDILDIAGMDYSPAKRKPPIHN